MSPLTLTLLFCAAAALCLGSAAAGGLFALWCVHVGRTGAHPLPKIPMPSFWKNTEDEDEPNNGRAQAPRRVGP